MLLGFEATEAMLWRHMLSADELVLMNSGCPRAAGRRPRSLRLSRHYPDDLVAAMRAAGSRVFSFDASAIAQELGDIRLGNTFMLWAIFAHLPFPAEFVGLNRQAFAAGRAAAEMAARAEEGGTS